MTSPVVNPEIPYNEEIPGGLQPGKMLRLQGVTHPEADRFNVNFQTGPSVKPRDDTALHLSARLNQGYIARNSYQSKAWQDEDGSGQLPIGKCQSWEILVLVNEQHYKIAINGQHFCDFPHRISFKDVTHLVIDGDVSITLISWEEIFSIDRNELMKRATELNSEDLQIPSSESSGSLGAYSLGNIGAPVGGYAPPPPGNYVYGVPSPPGAQAESGFEGFLGQAQEVLAGAIKSGAAEKLLSSFFNTGQSHQQQGYTHQNAKYGIYPDLTQDDFNTKAAPINQKPGLVDGLLSNLLTGKNKQLTSENRSSNPMNQNQQSMDITSLLSSLLNDKRPQGSVPNSDLEGKQNNSKEQQGQNVDWTGILGSLITGTNLANSRSSVPHEEQPKPEMNMQKNISMNQQNHNVDLGAILSNLISVNSSEKTVVDQKSPQNTQKSKEIDFNGLLSGLISAAAAQNVTRPIHLQNTQSQNEFASQQTNQQSPGADLTHLLRGILSNTISHPNQTAPEAYNNESEIQQNPSRNPPLQNISNAPGNQQSKGFDLGSLLTSLLAPHSTPERYQGNPNELGRSTSSVLPEFSPSQTRSSSAIGNSQNLDSTDAEKSTLVTSQEQVEDVSDKLAQVIASEKSPGQLNSSKTQQYGQYPHQENTQGQGPVESLLSNFLGGGGQTHAQQHPHFGGGDSIGGLGGMSGLLQNFAGQILQPKDQSQRQNF